MHKKLLIPVEMNDATARVVPDRHTYIHMQASTITLVTLWLTDTVMLYNSQ